MLNDNMMLFGMTHRKLVAINARDKFVGPGEVRKERQWAPLGDNLTVRHNAEAASKPIAIDLDPRWALAGESTVKRMQRSTRVQRLSSVRQQRPPGIIAWRLGSDNSAKCLALVSLRRMTTKTVCSSRRLPLRFYEHLRSNWAIGDVPPATLSAGPSKPRKNCPR